uniref:Glycosyltransferase 2-like domain-containing protein n=1 Tax=viral metagenome TaxID=1070528 RepID=A0A6C0KUM4_9ZZZZ
MKYPQVIFFRNEKYKSIDNIFKDESQLNCTVSITSNKEELNNLFDTNYQILVTFGENESEYIEDVFSILDGKYSSRWIHLKSIRTIQDFNSYINYCFIDNVIKPREETRPKFSVFTSCYNTYEKIHRVYNGLKSQKCKSWEWVIMDDSPDLDDKHFNFLREIFKNDKRVRLYRRSENSGSIGNVKNETVSLCRGVYVLELDHDDVILPDVLSDSINIFEQDKEIGFIYMDFINIYEDGRNFTYGDFIGKGYGAYYCQHLNIDLGPDSINKWVNVYNTPNINNITLSHLVCLPNHPRIWKREMLIEIGNYSEFLPICDDFEVLLRTAVQPKCKMAKLAKLGYIQYMNDGNNNFSLIRNREINRIGPNHIMPQFFAKYNVNEVMRNLEAEEDHYFMFNHSKLWEREPSKYQHKYCNKLLNVDFNKQYCILGLKAFAQNIELIRELYKDSKNDFIVLENQFKPEELCKIMDSEYSSFSRMKCYSMKETSWEKLERFFHLIYKSCVLNEVIREKQENDNYMIPFTTELSSRHQIINSFSDPSDIYLEIGVENGYTFNNVHFEIDNKIGVDPDPKFEYSDNITIIKKTSDEYFSDCDDEFDVIFIDGMHQCEYVLRDINNAIKHLKSNGKRIICIDDILPQNYREQFKIPILHSYENGILKYGEPWTGDVWKVAYYLLKTKIYENKFTITFWNHPYYRGVGRIKILDEFQLPQDKATLDEINGYRYFSDYPDYLKLLVSFC